MLIICFVYVCIVCNTLCNIIFRKRIERQRVLFYDRNYVGVGMGSRGLKWAT